MAGRSLDVAPAQRDPFALTADPDAYVARPASEEVLGTLEASLRESSAPCALTGPPGIGKSLLLRVLERRLADACTCVVLPYAALELDDLARWALGLLGHAPQRGDDAVAALLARAEQCRAEGGALVLMLDDASALAPDVARALVALCSRSRGALRLLVVPVDDGRAGSVLAALGRETREVRYRTPLSRSESGQLLRERLAGAAAPPHVLERFGAAVVARLHGLAGGNPRRLLTLAAGLLRGQGVVDPLAEGEPRRRGAHEAAWQQIEAEAEAATAPAAAEAPQEARQRIDGQARAAASAGVGTGGSTAAQAPAGLAPSDARRADATGGAGRQGQAAAVAALVVLLALSLVGLAWCVSPTAGPRDEALARPPTTESASGSTAVSQLAPPDEPDRSTEGRRRATPSPVGP